MNGAESLVRTLVTSEMHFVAALDRVDGMRAILGLFEGAVTGMADGYGHMAESPAATLLLSMAASLGIEATRAHTVEEFSDQFGRTMREYGTRLIEVAL